MTAVFLQWLIRQALYMLVRLFIIKQSFGEVCRKQETGTFSILKRAKNLEVH